MKIEHKPFIEQERVKEFGLDVFIKRTFECLRDELEHLRNTIYNYNEHNFIFALNERAWVGAFNNAILRAFPDTSATLQEYTVYHNKKFVGRADMLVHWKDKDGMVYSLIIEAKQYEETSFKALDDDSGKYLLSVKTQGDKYFNAEYNYYKDKTVYIIPIVFGWIRKKGFLDKAKSNLNDPEKKDKSSDFCSLYFEDDQGAWVYGKIYDARDSKALLK